MVRGHEGGVRTLDGSARGHARAREAWRDRGEERRSEGLGSGVAIRGLTPHRHGTSDAKRGKDTRFQGGALLLARAIGHRERQGLRLGTRVLPPDTARRRSQVPRASLHVNPHAGADRTGGKEPPRAEGGEAIADAAHRIVGTGLRGEGLTPKQCGVWVGAERVSTVPGAPATQRLQDQAQHDGACVHVQLWRDRMMHEADEPQWGGIRVDQGERLHGIPCALGR